MFTWSCSQKTLSIFFDGVPENDNESETAPANDESPEIAQQYSGSERAMPSQAYFMHAPFRERECTLCHDPKVMGQMQQPIPDLCYQCHEDYKTRYSVMHAPVESGECLICHSPHQALYNHLLNRPGQQVCFECHSQEDVLAHEPHGDIGDAACTECHNPHGGENQYILN